jgi:fructose-specific phosphotransferase system IIC component
MNTGNQVILGIVLGSMIAFDMGGPVNKVAFFFGAAMIQKGNFAVMGAVILIGVLADRLLAAQRDKRRAVGVEAAANVPDGSKQGGVG